MSSARARQPHPFLWRRQATVKLPLPPHGACAACPAAPPARSSGTPGGRWPGMGRRRAPAWPAARRLHRPPPGTLRGPPRRRLHGPLPGAACAQVRAAATAVAARAADALTGGACGGCQTELVQRAAFRLLGERCHGSPALRAHLFRWIYMCAESSLAHPKPACCLGALARVESCTGGLACSPRRLAASARGMQALPQSR